MHIHGEDNRWDIEVSEDRVDDSYLLSFRPNDVYTAASDICSLEPVEETDLVGIPVPSLCRSHIFGLEQVFRLRTRSAARRRTIERLSGVCRSSGHLQCIPDPPSSSDVGACLFPPFCRRVSVFIVAFEVCEV